MSVYQLAQGIEHKEDNSVSASVVWPFDYGPSFDDAVGSLMQRAKYFGRDLKRIDGGLFKHLPGVQAVFEEDDGDERHIWLIRLLTSK